MLHDRPVFLVQLPSPPGKNVFREWAGGMGTALPSARDHHGHDRDYYDIPYFQFLYVARGLETRGLRWRYFDFQAETRFQWERLEEPLRTERPLALVTVVNLPSLSSDRELLRRIRATAPDCRLVVLGPAAKLVHAELLAAGEADVVLDANEELAVPEMLHAWTRGEDAVESAWHLVDGRVVQAPPVHRMKDLDVVDYPAYELLDFARYESDFFLGRRYRYATVYTSKGCSYDCVYCPYPFGFGTRFLFRSPERVVADIERLHREHGVDQICFRDQVFTVKRKHTEAICRLLIEKDLPVHWLCETRYDVVDPELLALMARAGCREIHYGLESGDEEIFAAVGKPGGPVSLARFEDAIAWTKAAGLRVHLHLILGLPGESWKTIKNTLAFLRRTRPHTVQTAILSPYPGTPLHARLAAEGRLVERPWEDYGGFQAVQPTDHLSVAELQHAKEWLGWNWDKTFWDKVRLRVRRLFPGRAPRPASRTSP